MFRRTAFLDHLFERVNELPSALQSCGRWLPFQLQQHVAGALRIRETLSSISLVDGAGASYGYLSSPSTLNGKLADSPVDTAVAWLHALYREWQDLFKQWLPAAWHARFAPWLDAQSVTRRGTFLV